MLRKDELICREVASGACTFITEDSAAPSRERRIGMFSSECLSTQLNAANKHLHPKKSSCSFAFSTQFVSKREYERCICLSFNSTRLRSRRGSHSFMSRNIFVYSTRTVDSIASAVLTIIIIYNT